MTKSSRFSFEAAFYLFAAIIFIRAAILNFGSGNIGLAITCSLGVALYVAWFISIAKIRNKSE